MVLQAVAGKLLVEEGIKRGLKASQKYSVSVLGYDFIGLVSRLLVFYVVAFIINAYFIASIKGGIWLNTLAVLLGSKPFPDTLPQWITNLFTVGIGSKGIPVSTTPTAPRQFNPPGWSEKFEIGGEFEGLKYFDYGSLEHHKAEPDVIPALPTAGFTITFWQIIQIVSILIVVVEALQYDRMLKEKGEKPNVTTLAVFSLIGIGISLMTFPQMLQKMKERRVLSA